MQKDEAVGGPRTATLEEARAHARRQGGTNDSARRSAAAECFWDETVPGGNYATHRLPRDAVVSLTALDGDTCAAMAVHRAESPQERLNVADTVKVQWQAYPGEGSVLLSDMGRALMTIVSDTSPPGSHDALCGCTDAVTESARSGGPSGPWTSSPNARELLLAGLAKHGLGPRDLPPVLDLFAGVEVAADGALQLRPPVPPGASVSLRCEVDVVVTLAVVRHPLDPRPGSGAGRVRIVARRGPRPDHDPFRSSTPERARAFANTDESLAGGTR